MTDRILHIRETAKIAGLSVRTIYREMRADRFPRPVQLSARRVGWRESALVEWLAARQSA